MRRGRFGGATVGIIAALGLAAGTAVGVAATCNVFQFDFEIPDDLRDGDHVLASTRGPAGRLVASVTVRNGRAGQPWLTLNGKKMKVVPESSVPAAVLPCLKDSGRSPTGDAFELGEGWGSPGEVGGAPVDVRCKVTVKCVEAVGGGGYCSARAVCNGHVGYGFSTY